MIAKKKGRRPKSYYENLKLLDLSNNVTNANSESANGNTNSESASENTNSENVTIIDSSTNIVHKKRGRKPKGGNLIAEKKEVVELNQKPNIILHLNCKLSEITCNELTYNPNIDNIIEFDNTNYNFNVFDTTNNDTINNDNTNNNTNNNTTNSDNINKNNNLNNDASQLLNPNNPNTNFFLYDKKMLNDNVTDNKNIYKKLQELSQQLKSNNITKKSACFWCTYDFDNEAIMIPKYELKGVYHCYGNFCSPECAASFLMNENVDSSKKFERYYLLNNVYCKIYNYEKNIKCAPSPFYMLEKYYGNLSIQEYRKLLKNERLLLLVDKPLAKLLPELYDENEDYILNNKHINKNKYKINVK